MVFPQMILDIFFEFAEPPFKYGDSFFCSGEDSGSNVEFDGFDSRDDQTRSDSHSTAPEAESEASQSNQNAIINRSIGHAPISLENLLDRVNTQAGVDGH